MCFTYGYSSHLRRIISLIRSCRFYCDENEMCLTDQMGRGMAAINSVGNPYVIKKKISAGISVMKLSR